MSRSTKLARVALIAALLLPVYFMIAALGTKLGLWSWQNGLGVLTVTVGPILLGIVALVALVALIWCLAKAPRKGWWMALVALLIPGLALVTLGGMRDRASANPIHDVATDAVNPPVFPDEIVALRAANEFNPVRDYGAVLRDVGPWGEGGRFEDVADETHRSLVPRLYPRLAPLVTDASPRDALVAVQAAMIEQGLSDVTSDQAAGTVLAVAETFWFGFKDDIVARVRQGENGTVIDFRSVSRVGLSDLGANAKRVEELRAATEARLGTN